MQKRKGQAKMVDCLTILQKTETSCWSDVPPDVWSLILSRLFFNDRHNFRLVCKSWNSILPVKPTLPPPMNSLDSDWPCLMWSLRTTTSWKFYHSLHNEFYSLDFPELMDAQIYFSKSGWLLLGHESTLFFFSPLTKEKIELPPAANSFVWACFTSPPTSSDCYVFGLYLGSGFEGMDFGLIKVGDEDWKSEIYQNGGQFFCISDCPPLFHGGTYYLVDYETREIGTFDLRKDENRWTIFRRTEGEELTDEEDEEAEIVEEEEEEEEAEEEEEENEIFCTKKRSRTHESYMAEVDGEILGVFVTTDDRRVSVKRLDLTEMRWRKLDSLGNKCLYVSSYGSFAETCAINGMANKIYFNKFHGKRGVMYSLTTGMYHSVAGDFAGKGSDGLTHVDYGFWIKNSLRDE